MKKLIKSLFPIIDLLLLPFIYPAAFLLKTVRKAGVQRLPLTKNALFQVGVFPVSRHYYEPLFDARSLKQPLSKERDLPGIRWNVDEQLALLDGFQFSQELNDLSSARTDDLTFHFNNISFEAGDAEYWYNLIRLKRPRRIIEIGSGNSTLIAIRAIKKNITEMAGYTCKHICIEPYEMAWLEKTGASVLREKIEDVDKEFFSELSQDDILFIDSSHVIRPQGDVLFEYLELLPSLKRGVIVHVHDIFSPKDYLESWIREDVMFWNEQYLLEAFLTSNRDWKIIGALNYLHHHHYKKLKEKCPFLTPEKEPGSFYIQKVT